MSDSHLLEMVEEFHLLEEEVHLAYSNKEYVAWHQKIRKLLQKTVDKSDRIELLQETSLFAEKLVSKGLFQLAYSSIYEPFASYALPFIKDRRYDVEQPEGSVEGSISIPLTVVRFLTGRAFALYTLVVQKDELAVRKDTVEVTFLVSKNTLLKTGFKQKRLE